MVHRIDPNSGTAPLQPINTDIASLEQREAWRRASAEASFGELERVSVDTRQRTERTLWNLWGYKESATTVAQVSLLYMTLVGGGVYYVVPPGGCNAMPIVERSDKTVKHHKIPEHSDKKVLTQEEAQNLLQILYQNKDLHRSVSPKELQQLKQFLITTYLDKKFPGITPEKLRITPPHPGISGSAIDENDILHFYLFVEDINQNPFHKLHLSTGEVSKEESAFIKTMVQDNQFDNVYQPWRSIDKDILKTFDSSNDFLKIYVRMESLSLSGDLNDYPKATVAGQKMLQRTSHDAEFYYQFAIYCDALKSYEAAIEAATKAIDMNPEFVEAYVRRGFAYYSLDHYEEALEDFAKALELEPKKPDAIRLKQEVEQKIRTSE